METNQPPDLRNLVSNINDTLRATLDAAKSGPADDSDYESGHTRTGKVARLPAAVRDTVNLMLHDGVPYATIIQKLADSGYPGFTPSNLSRWKDAGYVDWVCQGQQAEEIKARSQWTQQLLNDLGKQDSPSLDQALDLLVTSQLLAALSRITTKEFSSALGHNKETLSKVLAVANGHFRERTRFQKLQFAIRQYEAAKAAQPDRGSPDPQQASHPVNP
jgi:hypothetical protein